MDGKRTFYITTPIYYVNAEPHIGHAYTQIAADTLARYHRMKGEDVLFLTGTDEHGNKIERAAREAGYPAGAEKQFVDGIVDRFKAAWGALDISYDRFIRTTDPEHGEQVRSFLMRMKDKGDIYEGEYDGCYCTPCETFWTEKEAEEGVCPQCARSLEKIKEKNYFFRMGRYRDWLVSHIEENPCFCMPDFRRNEVLGFLKDDLNDLCISRPKSRMSWGIELPFDPDYVVYVWFDALINYSTGAELAGMAKRRIWPPDIHMIAKDILRHHAVYWPIMLRSMDMELPRSVFAHGWWKMGEEKISKSKGNIVDPLQLVEQYGVDALRYFVLKAINFGSDGVFTEELMRTTYNNDLANDLGNLLNRTLTMVEKYFDGTVPEFPRVVDAPQLKRSGQLCAVIEPLAASFHEKLVSPELKIKEALEEVMDVIDTANKYIERSAPWEYSKKGEEEPIKLMLLDLLGALRTVCVLLSPVMPASMRKMWRQLGFEGDPADALRGLIEPDGDLEAWRDDDPGRKVAKGEVLFPRIQG